jgi:hypothetical protein
VNQQGKCLPLLIIAGTQKSGTTALSGQWIISVTASHLSFDSGTLFTSNDPFLIEKRITFL